MWHILESFRLNGYHFRKQVQIGAYVADFACHHAMVVVEVDGEQHDAPVAAANDATRDQYLRERGFKVIRVPSIELSDNREGVFQLIQAALASTPPRVRRTPSLAALGPDGPSSATLPARGRGEKSNG